MKLAGLTLAYWSLIVAAMLPFVCAVIAKRGGASGQDGFDNHLPRAWLARQTDWRARANAAQANSFEALPLFMAAVIVAHQLGVHQVRLDLLAFLFVVLRLVYILLYLADLATARSAVWALALLVNLAIFFA